MALGGRVAESVTFNKTTSGKCTHVSRYIYFLIMTILFKKIGGWVSRIFVGLPLHALIFCSI